MHPSLDPEVLCDLRIHKLLRPAQKLGAYGPKWKIKIVVSASLSAETKNTSEIRPTSALDHHALAPLGEQTRTSSVVEVSVMRMQYRLQAHTSTVPATAPRALAIPAMYYLMATGIAFVADLNKALAFA